MPIGRIPGPYGHGDTYGCIYLAAGLGVHPWRRWGDEFPHVTLGPSGTNDDLGERVVEIKLGVTEEDKKELRLLQDVFRVIGNAAYGHWDKKKKWHDNFEAYVAHRNAYFGSAAGYQAAKATALAELDADKGRLRRLIEPGEEQRKKKKDGWKDAQTVFYTWVRKAYQKKLGDAVDIPKLIKSGMSEKLREALKKVRVDFGKQFQAGGFNPRPMKLNGRYRLGTLSEHAVGNAVDIDSERNAQITAKTWRHILKFTAKSLDHDTRKTKWKLAPQQLHQAVKEINDEFVKKLREVVKAAEEAAAKKTAKVTAPAAGSTTPATTAPAAAAPKNAPEVDGRSAKADAKIGPMQAAMAANEHLREIGVKFLTRWRDGFFALEWALVKELHEEGFVWGATFGDPDLHHFEL